MWIESEYNAMLAQLDRFIERQARALAGRDAFFGDDLQQEMRLAIWTAGPGHKPAYYRSRAVSRAHDHMRVHGRWGKREQAAGGLNDLEELDQRTSLDECAISPSGKCAKCGGTGCGERVL